MLGSDPGKRGRGKRQVGTGLRWTTHVIFVQKVKKFMRSSNRDGEDIIHLQLWKDHSDSSAKDVRSWRE